MVRWRWMLIGRLKFKPLPTVGYLLVGTVIIIVTVVKVIQKSLVEDWLVPRGVDAALVAHGRGGRGRGIAIADKLLLDSLKLLELLCLLKESGESLDLRGTDAGTWSIKRLGLVLTDQCL